MRALRKEKKFALISGKELKSVVIRGKLEEKIISNRLDKKPGLITLCSFSKTAVKRATNSCYFVSGMQS